MGGFVFDSATAPANNQTVCGDLACAQIGANGIPFALVVDGAGTGDQANIFAEFAFNAIISYLRSGKTPAEALMETSEEMRDLGYKACAAIAVLKPNGEAQIALCGDVKAHHIGRGWVYPLIKPDNAPESWLGDNCGVLVRSATCKIIAGERICLTTDGVRLEDLVDICDGNRIATALSLRENVDDDAGAVTIGLAS